VAKFSHGNSVGHPEITKPNNRYLHKPEVYRERLGLPLTVTGIDRLRILEVMADYKGFEPISEDPLDQLLDEESDEEFGLPEFREHFADSLTPAVLKDWTAKDFASIYVRFLEGETVYRFIYRVDGQPAWRAALTPFKGTAATVSPFVTLEAR
jgi:hypothetical protein